MDTLLLFIFLRWIRICNRFYWVTYSFWGLYIQSWVGLMDAPVDAVYRSSVIRHVYSKMTAVWLVKRRQVVFKLSQVHSNAVHSIYSGRFYDDFVIIIILFTF